MVTLRTRNRKLEQTLFNLGVTYLDWEKDEDGLTVWIYPNTEKVKTIMTWFTEANRRRVKGGW
jgi:hypothetical protein